MNEVQIVAKLNLKSKREYLLVKEVADQYESTPNELFAEAAIGELTIYVKIERQHACIYGSEQQNRLIPNTDGDMVVDKMWNKDEGASEIPNEYFRHYLYGLLPIHPGVFEWKKDDRELRDIKLDFSKILSSGKFFEKILVHFPQIKLQDALDDGMLFVLESDIKKLLSVESTDKENGRQKGGEVQNATKGPRPETDAKYNEWQRLADDIMKNKPRLKGLSAVAGAVHRLVANGPIQFYGSISTIRKHISVKTTEN
jgi:hypothetical protein